MTITARFATTPGLYKGNQVKILGMPVGTVTSVHPGPNYVSVVMHVPASTRIPASAKAVILAPQVVNDRYVQLTPAYTGGPLMTNHAVIPVANTAVPISVDEIIKSLDQLAVALGPSGANRSGALSALIASAAKAFGPNGAPVHSTLTSLGQAFGALSSQGPDLTTLLNSLGNLSHVTSQFTGTYQAFANDLAAVSTDLANDNQSLGAALANLQQALGQLSGFIQTNGAVLGASVANLKTFAGVVAQKQQQLAQVLGVLPVTLQNLNNAYDPKAPGGPALRARYDGTTGSVGFSKSVCGNPLLRLLLVALNQPQHLNDKDASIDLACGTDGLFAAIPTPPGASTGPNLSLSALVQGRP